MRSKIEWQARVQATENVDSIVDFADETLRGLVLSEMVPESAWVEAVGHDFNRHAYTVIRWDTINEMEHRDEVAS